MERPDHLPLVTVSVLEREHEEMVSDFTFFQFCFLKIAVKQKSTLKEKNLQEKLHNTTHKPVEGEEELTSPCSVLSITSSKESVARWCFVEKLHFL